MVLILSKTKKVQRWYQIVVIGENIGSSQNKGDMNKKQKLICNQISKWHHNFKSVKTITNSFQNSTKLKYLRNSHKSTMPYK